MTHAASPDAALPAQAPRIISSTISARLDSLRWSRFHTLVVVALGVTWILDGLAVTLAGNIAPALEKSPALHFTVTQVGTSASAYLIGAVLGSLFFGWLTDRLGRKKLFFITLGTYLVGTIATSFSWDFWSFCLFRVVTGAGIGGEYSAINSTIQEFMPARYRGRVDLLINGSFWLGAAFGAGATILVFDPAIISMERGWRLAFLIGALLGFAILFVRRLIPESPRWLLVHGREAEAEESMRVVERLAHEHAPPSSTLPPLSYTVRSHTPLREVFDVLLVRHRTRALVGLALMAAQAFFYNAVFFGYAQFLIRFYGVSDSAVGLYTLPFCIGNFLGPVILGPLFDTVGRRVMIASTYIISGILLAVTGWMFMEGMLTATTQTLAWSVIFFFASSAAGAAYLTVGESFPLEMRALAIAIFYALGTGIGGVVAPTLFSSIIEQGSKSSVLYFYLGTTVMMVGAGLIEAIWGVDAEGKGLEEVATPLSASAPKPSPA